MNGKKKLSEKKIPHIATKLRDHIVTVPHEILAASGIVIMGRRIKSLIFSTDIAIIRNCNADAVLAVYPFTPQQIIADAIVSTSSMPVFCGVGGGTTTGARVVMLAKDAEALGATAVVVNAPTSNTVIQHIRNVVDIPIVVTVLDENTDIEARLAAGAGILKNTRMYPSLQRVGQRGKVSPGLYRRARMPSALHRRPQLTFLAG